MSTIVFLETVISYGGARKSTVELARRLRDAGYEVFVYDAYGNCQPFIDACKNNDLNVRILCPSKDSHILTATNPIKRIINTVSFIFNLIKINHSVRGYLLKDEPQYIIVNNSKVLSFVFRKPKNVKIMLFARGWFIGKQIRKIDRFLYKHFVDRYVCVSEATRYAIYGAGLAPLKDIFVVHNAIDEKQIDNDDTSITFGKNKFKILVSGGFLPSKGIDVAIKTAAELRQKQIDFFMIVTGMVYKTPVSKNYFKQIKQLIIDNDLSEHIEIVENHTEVIEYFKWCDILIHPSSTEGLPRVVMEAMYFRKPVIANAVGGVTDYILNGYTGFLTNYNNVHDYVEAIQLLHNNPNIYQLIADRAYDLVKTTFTPQNQINSMVSALK